MITTACGVGVVGGKYLAVSVYSLVSSRCYEVDAAMDTAVRDVPLALNADLFIQVQLKLVIDVVQHGLPTAHTDKHTHYP